MTTPIKPGTLAIFSDCEAPSAYMVAVVTKVAKGRAWGRYLSDYPKKSCDPQGPVKDWHAVEDFGVWVSIDLREGLIKVFDVCHESIVTYEDGVPRSWQDYRPGYIRSAKKRRWAQWAVNKQIAKRNADELAEIVAARVARRMEARS